ncbi:MAG TPA: FecR domain-containing protein [Pseudolabrys sp.]|nr:FecR domain-containing protein [Pseudolabrys sp.]
MMRAPKSAVLVTGVALFAGAFLSGQALSQNAPPQPAVQGASITPIGKVVTAAGSVSIEHVSAVVIQASLGGQSGGAKVGDSVYLGDIVSTGSDGRVGITFTDGTAFDLSPNARMVMNEFIYDPNSKSNSSLLSLTKGTFTFVAGKIAKSGDMKVNTPVATMGIRGTTPRVEIADDGSVKFSTLIEESRDRANSRATPGAAPAVEERDKPNLQICRGC